MIIILITLLKTTVQRKNNNNSNDSHNNPNNSTANNSSRRSGRCIPPPQRRPQQLELSVTWAPYLHATSTYFIIMLMIIYVTLSHPPLTVINSCHHPSLRKHKMVSYRHHFCRLITLHLVISFSFFLVSCHHLISHHVIYAVRCGVCANNSVRDVLPWWDGGCCIVTEYGDQGVVEWKWSGMVRNKCILRGRKCVVY